ncbi:MAG: bifunctional phosphoribosyl-AMP cyclohydrolase/phosphoribosyl-ATP diphosphatase HisIE [Aquificaceae bacterium]|nr:bifunctional phosphoribosyl-AMP cyclohydrolase/phosphoribosyl-ATP diphosphatase HisIE [Aquificaceae bacterium]MDW8237351.1 bifunctional phosphoribosyl-AMP cyclohydrolase/phosphoribosyl-ATP diphosphatase HisIE [Aquificaceae bacterium]
MQLEELKFDQNGLLPVIAQDWHSGEVRMFAWANKEAIELSLKTGFAHYYSRSRGSIWKKGETSGELQRIVDIRIDCDGDAILYLIIQEKNIACHTGERNCFFKSLKDPSQGISISPFEILKRLEEIILSRLEEAPEGSYTARLASEGKDRVFQKFGEEAIETLIALKNEDEKAITDEVSDLLYHLLLSLSMKNIPIEKVLLELISRVKP